MNLEEATMLALQNKLIEAKQVGTLYHYTNLEGLRGIAQDNTLKGNYGRQCFTRRKDLMNTNWSVYSDVKIIVDGDLLSEQFKIRPTNQVCDRMEAEERISVSQINNFSKYVQGVEISKKAFSNFKDKFRKYPHFLENIADLADWEKMFKDPENWDYAKFYNFETKKFDIKAYYNDTIELCKRVFKNVSEV